MAAEQGKPFNLGLAAAAGSVVLLFTVGCMIAGARSRGIWIDEIWTLWMSQHDLPLGEVIAHRWTQDVHPMFFFALNWALRPLVGDDIVMAGC